MARNHPQEHLTSLKLPMKGLREHDRLPVTTKGSAPQEWLSELEVDERRELIYNSLTGGLAKPLTSRLHEIMAIETNTLLGNPWFEQLTMEEVVELNTIEGWGWEMLAEYEEGQETTPRDLIEFRLANCLHYLNEFCGEDAWHDAVYGTNNVAAQLSFIRRLAGMYDLNIEEFWTENCQ